MSIYQLDFCFPAVHKANWGQLTPAGLLGLIAFMDHGVSVAFLGSWIMAFYLSAKNPCRVLTVPAHFPEARLWIVSVGRPSGSYLVDSHPKETRAIMRRSNLHSRDRPGLYSSARWQLQFEAWFTSPSLKTAVLG